MSEPTAQEDYDHVLAVGRLIFCGLVACAVLSLVGLVASLIAASLLLP